MRIIDVKMEEAIKAISTMRGHDLRDFMLLAFGGAGPLHAGRIARDLGMAGVIVPLYPGVYSAIGLLMSDVKHDYIRSRMTALAEADAGRRRTRCSRDLRRKPARNCTRTAFAERISASSARSTCATPARATRSPCPAATSRCATAISTRAAHDTSTQQHKTMFGHSAPEEPVEIVSYRVRGVGLVPPVELPTFEPAGATLADAHARSAGACASTARTLDCPVYQREQLDVGLQASRDRRSSISSIAPP